MKRKLTRDDVAPAMIGDLLLSAGGSGVARSLERHDLAADRDGRRVATFPDMIGSLDPATGDPIAIVQLPPGTPVAIVAAHRSGFPLGKGALDPAVFREVEEALGIELFSHLSCGPETAGPGRVR